MSNIIPFTGNFPTHFAADADAFKLNDAAEEFASVKFPVISAKNGRFSIKRDGEKVLLLRPKTNPSDPDEPASYFDMTVLNVQKSKTYYVDGYTEGSSEKPDCFSNDGITPDSSIHEPQFSNCAMCPHNAWGSGINEKGEATAGKACSDVQRLAVASPSNLDDPYMFRVPPASLKNFAEVSKFLTTKRVPLNGAVIRFSFDAEKTGVIRFEAIGGLDAATYAIAKSKMDDDLVLSIVGKKAGHSAPAPAAKQAVLAETVNVSAQAAASVDAEAASKAAKAAAKAKKLADAQAALAAAQSDDDEDEAPAPVVQAAAAAPAAKAPAKTKAPVASSSDFAADLAKLME